MAAKYGHKHATEPAYIEHVVNSAINIGHDVDGVKGMLMDKYMEYVSKNLLEVRSDAMSEFDITFWYNYIHNVYPIDCSYILMSIFYFRLMCFFHRLLMKTS